MDAEEYAALAQHRISPSGLTVLQCGPSEILASFRLTGWIDDTPIARLIADFQACQNSTTLSETQFQDDNRLGYTTLARSKPRQGVL